MSHFTVMVIGPDPEQQLAPFQEIEGNERSKWDWYSLGGRWTGFLKLKPGAVGTLGEPGVFDNEPAHGNDSADQARKGNIDIEGLRQDAAHGARTRWQAFHDVADLYPPFARWSVVRDSTPEIDTARVIYQDQEAVQALRQANLLPWDEQELTELLNSKEEYTTRAARRALTTFAFLQDGEWYEQGNMGWFGVVTNEKDPNEFERRFSELFDALPDDTLISIYDCHI